MDSVITDSLTKASPMMLQWQACKKAAGDAILFFRMGDFYEAFHQDAAIIAKELELTLTKRQEIPMSGVPHHTCEGYIDKLVAKGYRVAVAEQTEDSKKAKGLVKREIVRVVTPGTLISSSLLSDKKHNFFVAISKVGTLFGLAVLEVTTADFRVTEFESEQELLNELYRLRPAEFLISSSFQEKYGRLFTDMKPIFDFLVTPQEEWRFQHQVTHDFLLNHLNVHSLDGFGLKGMLAGINAAGALLSYLQETLCVPIDHIAEIHPYFTEQFMAIDHNTQRHLELLEPLHEHNHSRTLIGLLDKTQTPMGARLLRHWVKQPLLSIPDIIKRQDAVETFYLDYPHLSELAALLTDVRDLERLMTRVTTGCASPRDLIALRTSFEPIDKIKKILYNLPSTLLIQENLHNIELLPEMTSLIGRALVDDPPLRLHDGHVIRDGFHQELDELRSIGKDSHTWLNQYQGQLREQSGVKTLKVGYNRMTGYFVEVGKGHAERLGDSFQRRQTLTNAERFITVELKDFEAKVLTAEERIAAIENELFTTVRLEVAKYASQVMRTAHALANIDCLCSLAAVAQEHRYTRPTVDGESLLHIVDGRHPIIEAAYVNEIFTPNDTVLDNQEQRLILITGPNMAGKSTYIRQVALIVIMAQIGSFVPTKSAKIGLIDKVFSRIGASDDLSRGLSTFMVEMIETANILNNATPRSLVILDEIGRGTSTYDGISIAWAVAEHLLLTEGKLCKTLFATHYWELTKLEGKIPGAVNYNVAVQESGDQIRFLRKIVRGGSDRSYGIHVGRLAGLPPVVLARAQEILTHLEENANRKSAFEPARPIKRPSSLKKTTTSELQLSFFGPSSTP